MEQQQLVRSHLMISNIDGAVTIDTDDSSTDGNITFTTSIEGKGDGD